MAEDERDASPKPGFDPGDSSQVRKAVEQGLVPPAPRVPAMPPTSAAAKGVFVPKAPAVPARAVATSPLAPKAVASSSVAGKASSSVAGKDAPSKGGHVHAALAPAPETSSAEKSSVEKSSVEKSSVEKSSVEKSSPEGETNESTGVRAAEDRSPGRPRLPIDARPRPTIPARPSAERVESGEHEAVRAKSDRDDDDRDALDDDDDLEPGPFANRASVDIELPEGFDDPGSHSARLSLPGPIARFGRYDVLGRLAIGGMAEIYLAQEPIPGGGIRPVVVKVLRKQLANDEDFEQLFLREGRVAMQLSHPHISTVFEFGKWGGHFFIAMEYVEGATLKDILERNARRGETALDPEVAVGIVAKVASALDYAHTARDTRRKSLGVVHRDVSPHNLMVRFDGVVKLLDFGVAKVAQSEEESRSDAVKGKFGYLSPEQCRAAPVDGRSDVFALGVCLWEALTGARLYKRGSQFDTFRAILEEPPPSVREVRPELPEELDQIVSRALAKNPSDRFASAGEMQEALEAWLTTRGAVVTAARLRRTMAELFADEIRSGLRLESGPKIVERLRSTSVHPPLSTSDRPPPPDEALETTVAAPPSKRRGPLLLVAALVLVGLAIGGYFAFARPEPVAPVGPTPEERLAEEARARAIEAQQAEEAAVRREAEARAAAERAAAAEDRAAAERAVAIAAAEREAAEAAARAAAEAAARSEDRPRREAPPPRRRPGFVADPGF